MWPTVNIVMRELLCADSDTDIKRQMHELATAVYQIKGHIKGRTLLPFPQGAANIDQEEKKVRESDGREVDTMLKNNIEAIVSKWAYQVQNSWWILDLVKTTFLVFLD